LFYHEYDKKSVTFRACELCPNFLQTSGEKSLKDSAFNLALHVLIECRSNFPLLLPPPAADWLRSKSCFLERTTEDLAPPISFAHQLITGEGFQEKGMNI
jgi:hypothetical protein